MLTRDAEDKQAEWEAHVERTLYKIWVQASGETNEQWLEHLRNCVKVAIDECLTQKQKQYLLLYLNGYNQVEITRMLSVDRCTVSKTLHRAINNLQRYLRFATPSTLHTSGKVKAYLTRLYK